MTMDAPAEFEIEIEDGADLLFNYVASSPTCFDGNNGAIAGAAAGGVAPYTYTLDSNPPQANGNYQNLTPGIYFVTVTDANGCEKQFTIIVPNADEMVFNYAAGPPTCHDGNDGAIVGAAAGGTAPYTYSINGGPNQANGNFQNLFPGLYFVGVEDANGCFKTFQITVDDTPDMVVDYVHTASLSCHNDDNATISVNSVSNATLPITYKLNGVVGGPVWVNLPAGVYTLSVSDGRPCSKTFTITIDTPPAIDNDAILFDLTCFGSADGVVSPFVFGGTPPLETSLNGGAFAAPAPYTNLSAGPHTLMVKDANGCQLGATYTLLQPLPLVSDTASVIHSGGTDGAIDVETSGGTLPYSYSWSNGELTQDLENLAPGTYLLATTDINGCPADTLTVEVEALCSAGNFANPPVGLAVDQSASGGTKTRLLWDHYSDASDGCLIKGGTISSLDPGAPYTQNPGTVLVQGAQVQGNANGQDYSALLSSNAEFTLFNASTYPAGNTGTMVPGAFYKFKVQCGCIIDPSITGPARFAANNVHLSPWSENKTFTNLSIAANWEEQTDGSENKILDNAKFNLFPNPNNGQFQLIIKEAQSELIQVRVRDLAGKIVVQSRVQNNKENRLELDISEMPNGIFMVEIIDGDRRITEKVIKQ